MQNEHFTNAKTPDINIERGINTQATIFFFLAATLPRILHPPFPCSYPSLSSPLSFRSLPLPLFFPQGPPALKPYVGLAESQSSEQQDKERQRKRDLKSLTAQSIWNTLLFAIYLLYSFTFCHLSVPFLSVVRNDKTTQPNKVDSMDGNREEKETQGAKGKKREEHEAIRLSTRLDSRREDTVSIFIDRNEKTCNIEGVEGWGGKGRKVEMNPKGSSHLVVSACSVVIVIVVYI